MKLDQLTKTGAIQLHSLHADADHARDALLALSAQGLCVRFIRGKKSATAREFFDEISAVLQFPFYFGGNWDAFDECMADLSWLDTKGGLILVFTDASDILSAATAKDMDTLKNILVEISKQWSAVKKSPFHIVLQVDVASKDRLKSRWGDVTIL